MTGSGFSIERIEALVEAARGRGLAVLELNNGNAVLRVRFERPAGTRPDSEAAMRDPSQRGFASRAAAGVEAVRSPGVGRFLARHELGVPPVAASGERVEAGALVGFVRSASVILAVRAGRAGRLGPALVANGAAVEFGAPLFELGDDGAAPHPPVGTPARR